MSDTYRVPVEGFTTAEVEADSAEEAREKAREQTHPSELNVSVPNGTDLYIIGEDGEEVLVDE